MDYDEIIKFEKPIILNGDEIYDTGVLREYYECGYITLKKYDKILEQIKNGEIGVVKERKHYKEMYYEACQVNASLRKQLYEICELIDQIEIETNDVRILKLIDRVRR